MNAVASALPKRDAAGKYPTIATGIINEVNPEMTLWNMFCGYLPKYLMLSKISGILELPTHLNEVAAIINEIPIITHTPDKKRTINCKTIRIETGPI